MTVGGSIVKTWCAVLGLASLAGCVTYRQQPLNPHSTLPDRIPGPHEVAIFYFSEHQDLAHLTSHPERLITAGQNRMRPIAMTTLAAILTLLPLAFALGQGSSMQQPLAIAIISGLIVQLPLVLCVMPVLFSVAQGRATLR